MALDAVVYLGAGMGFLVLLFFMIILRYVAAPQRYLDPVLEVQRLGPAFGTATNILTEEFPEAEAVPPSLAEVIALPLLDRYCSEWKNVLPLAAKVEHSCPVSGARAETPDHVAIAMIIMMPPGDLSLSDNGADTPPGRLIDRCNRFPPSSSCDYNKNYNYMLGTAMGTLEGGRSLA